MEYDSSITEKSNQLGIAIGKMVHTLSNFKIDIDSEVVDGNNNRMLYNGECLG